MRSDQYHLSMVLVAASVGLFIWEWRRPSGSSGWLRWLGLGAFVGLVTAHKVTLAPLGLMVMVPALSHVTRRAEAALAIGFIGLFWIATATGAVLGAYLFRFDLMTEAVKRLVGLLMFAGGEEDFWRGQVDIFLWQYSYGYIAAFWLVSFVVVAVATLAARRGDWRVASVLVGSGVIGLGAVAFLYKRPAGTTAFDMTLVLSGLSAMVLAVSANGRMMQCLVAAAVAAWAAYAAMTFPLGYHPAGIAESRARADALWGVHQKILEIDTGRRIIVLIPDDSYRDGGVHGFLLKGAADFSEWRISAEGQRVIYQFAPGMEFRHEYRSVSPEAEIPSGALVAWFEKPDLPDLMSRYPSVRSAVEGPRVVRRRWETFRNGRTHVVVHVALIP